MPKTVPVYTVHGVIEEEEPLHEEDCLYHYTTAEGLQGILQNKILRATFYTMLNDPDELIRGRDIIRAEIPRDEEQFMRIGKTWSDFDRDHYFITSLTEHADDIDMWRSYSGGGFNIIFSRDRLEESVKGSSLLKVVYTEEGIRARARQEVNSILQSENDDRSRATDGDVGTRSDSLINLSGAYKSPTWAHEAEWRLFTTRHILCGGDDDDRYCMKFAPSHYGPRPYVEQQIVDPSCIMGVTVGPGPYMAERATGASWLLDQNKIQMPAYCSTIRYRP